MKAVLSACCLALVTFSSSIVASSAVTTSKAETLLTFPRQSAPAKIVALNQAMVPAQVAAMLVKLPVKVGDNVVKGETMAELDCRNFKLAKNVEEARLAQSKSQFEFARRELKRGQKLATERNIGEAELDRRKTVSIEAEALLRTQQNSLNLAQLNVEKCLVVAPFDGVVIKRIASEGEMLDVGKPVVELLQLSSLEVSAKVSDADMASFEKARSFSFLTSSAETSVQLRQVLPFIETNTRSREARFFIDSQSAVAGSIGRLQWESPMAHLPAHLLQTRNGSKGYFVERGGKAVFVAVGGAEEGRPIPYRSAIDEKIIVDGRHGLNDGDDVRVVTAASVRGS